jgi:hypothetical protein
VTLRERIETGSQDHIPCYAARNRPGQCVLCVTATHNHNGAASQENSLRDFGSDFGRYLGEHGAYILAEECFAFASAEAQGKVITEDLGIVVELAVERMGNK